MAGPLSRIARRGRVVQWAALYEAAKVIYGHGRRMYRNLSPAERERLGQLMRKSHGKRSNLNEREQRRIFELVRKAVTGS
ncbi:MAG TPA: hypothetical protein VIL53_06345 [Solirubrobacterales bacterium]|jgi:hypothetical protein